MSTAIAEASTRSPGRAAPPSARGRLFNPYDAAFLADPYPTYARLRHAAPLFGIAGCRGRDWIVTSHALVSEILCDTRFGIDDLPQRIAASAGAAGVTLDRLPDSLTQWLFFIDPPRHGELRRRLAALFRRPLLDSVQAGVNAAAQSIVRAAKQRGELDLIAELASPLPACATSLLMGVETGELHGLAALSSDVFEVFAQPLPLSRYRRIDTQLAELNAAIQTFARSPTLDRNGFLHAMLTLEREGAIPAQAGLAVCAMLFSVGQDTAQGLIGNAVLTMLRHKEAVLEAARAPSLLPLLRELARYEAPVQMVLRIVKVDASLAGQQMYAGERVHLFLGAALRDEAMFEDAGSFRPQRQEVSMLPFGAGVHFCLGSQIALLQLEAVVTALLPELRDLVLDEASLRRTDCTHLRRPKAATLRWR